MPEYRRPWTLGGTFFFTVNLWQREGNTLLVDHIDLLRDSVRAVKNNHPFTIHGWVVLPEHMHCLFSLAENEADFALRWRLIKGEFSQRLPHTPNHEFRSASRQKRGERGIWQRRYFEHRIRNQNDFNAHMDYIHINPLKHGLVSRVQDWPFSTFHRLVDKGVYSLGWAGGSLADSLEYED